MDSPYSGTDKPIKIFWFGDGACVSTGFGRVANGILGGLYKTTKYDIIQLGLNYYGDPHKKPYDIFPARTGDPYGLNRLYEVFRAVNPDVFITNNDVWAMEWVAKIVTRIRQELDKPIPWIAYFPIDGTPLKISWINFIHNSIDIPIVYTKWAMEILQSMDPTLKLDYVYHGVDLEVFKKDDSVKEQMKEQLSDELGRKINFVIGYVGRNQPRKRLPELLLAYKKFVVDKQDTLLFLHTPVIDEGWHLKNVIESLQMPKNQILTTPGFIVSNPLPDHKLVALYNLFDVLCLPTVGEGFGLPLIEGMACGCPIVSTNCSVIPEIVGNCGILVDPDHYQVMPKDNELIRPIPGVSGMVAAFDSLYHNKGLFNMLSANSLERAKDFGGWSISKWEDIIARAVQIISNKQKGSLDFDLGLFEEVT